MKLSKKNIIYQRDQQTRLIVSFKECKKIDWEVDSLGNNWSETIVIERWLIPIIKNLYTFATVLVYGALDFLHGIIAFKE